MTPFLRYPVGAQVFTELLPVVVMGKGLSVVSRMVRRPTAATLTS
jgi:hypothetical protein